MSNQVEDGEEHEQIAIKYQDNPYEQQNPEEQSQNQQYFINQANEQQEQDNFYISNAEDGVSNPTASANDQNQGMVQYAQPNNFNQSSEQLDQSTYYKGEAIPSNPNAPADLEENKEGKEPTCYEKCDKCCDCFRFYFCCDIPKCDLGSFGCWCLVFILNCETMFPIVKFGLFLLFIFFPPCAIPYFICGMLGSSWKMRSFAAWSFIIGIIVWIIILANIL